MRSQTFTEPRQITLDPRFEGAVTVNIWTGYAVQIVSNSGERRVVVGPATVVLRYDETLEAMALSTGTPKTDEDLMHTVYLRYSNNKVSDLIEAETRDLCNVHVRVSYRVNFEGDPERWFNVENYVKFLTDHLRSVVRSAVKRGGIEDFHNDAIAIVRDAVLGASSATGRPGRNFEENGMRVYDVDILDVGIGDEAIAEMFQQTQHEVVRQAIMLAQEEQALQATIRTEQIKQATQEARFETTRKDIAIKTEELARNLELQTARIQGEAAAALLQLQQKEQQQVTLDAVHQAELARNRSQKVMDLELAEQALQQRLTELAGQVRATVDKAGAISPDLIAGAAVLFRQRPGRQDGREHGAPGHPGRKQRLGGAAVVAARHGPGGSGGPSSRQRRPASDARQAVAQEVCRQRARPPFGARALWRIRSSEVDQKVAPHDRDRAACQVDAVASVLKKKLAAAGRGLVGAKTGFT
jgi:major vault protein